MPKRASFKKDVLKILAETGDGSIPAAKRRLLQKKYRFKTPRALLQALTKKFRHLAVAPISGYRVSIAGLEKETGDILLGANIEFPGAILSATVHAEQFLFSRAYHRGHSIAEFALETATPCGHCRQFIREFQNGDQVCFSTASGLTRRIGALLPLGFGPKQLGRAGAKGRKTGVRPSKNLVVAARAAMRASYAPYSKCAAGIALQSKAGEIVSGSYIENAAFNPSLPPLQAALINWIAAGKAFSEIRSAVLVQKRGKVDHFAASKELLFLIAPRAVLRRSR